MGKKCFPLVRNIVHSCFLSHKKILHILMYFQCERCVKRDKNEIISALTAKFRQCFIYNLNIPIVPPVKLISSRYRHSSLYAIFHYEWHECVPFS